MKPTYVVLLAAVALAGTTGAVAAAGSASGQAGPTWPGPDDDPTTTANNSSSGDVSPGQQFAGAVGAQGASVQGELWNRTLTERLANASTDDERARVVADEVETIETYLDTLEGVRENVTERWAEGEISEGEYRTTLTTFVVHARTVERRANRTARAAEELPVRVRDNHDVNLTRVRNLAERAHALYQFDGEIGQEVANETLSNMSGHGPSKSERDGDGD